MRNFALFLCVATLAGCGTWSRPNTTDAQFYQDRAECEMQANQVYPVMMTSGAGYQAASQTRCTTSYGVTNCTTMPGNYVAGPQTDSNLIPRIGFHMSCLQGRGYTQGR